MPIPLPNKNESKKEYVSRLVTFFKNEGKPESQAVAIAFKEAKQHGFADAQIAPQWRTYSEPVHTTSKDIQKNGTEWVIHTVLALEMVQEYSIDELPFLKGELPDGIRSIPVFKDYDRLKKAIPYIKEWIPWVIPHTRAIFLKDRAPDGADQKQWINPGMVKGRVEQIIANDTSRSIESLHHVIDTTKHTTRELQLIEMGMDVSIGFASKFIWEPGEYNGKSYLLVQDDFRFGHLAGLPDQKGKCSFPKCGTNMGSPTQGLDTKSTSEVASEEKAYPHVDEEYAETPNEVSVIAAKKEDRNRSKTGKFAKGFKRCDCHSNKQGARKMADDEENTVEYWKSIAKDTADKLDKFNVTVLNAKDSKIADLEAQNSKLRTENDAFKLAVGEKDKELKKMDDDRKKREEEDAKLKAKKEKDEEDKAKLARDAKAKILASKGILKTKDGRDFATMCPKEMEIYYEALDMQLHLSADSALKQGGMMKPVEDMTFRDQFAGLPLVNPPKTTGGK